MDKIKIKEKKKEIAAGWRAPRLSVQGRVYLESAACTTLHLSAGGCGWHSDWLLLTLALSPKELDLLLLGLPLATHCAPAYELCVLRSTSLFFISPACQASQHERLTQASDRPVWVCLMCGAMPCLPVLLSFRARALLLCSSSFTWFPHSQPG